jgi:hypothetical protein
MKIRFPLNLRLHGILSLGMIILTFVIVSDAAGQGGDTADRSALRIYSRRMDPREHPDYSRYAVQPPHADIFGGKVRFTSLRDFTIKDNTVVNYKETLDDYVVKHDLGDVLWISYPSLLTVNLSDLLDEIKRRDLFLFDVWGFVPGSGPGSFWYQYQIPKGVLENVAKKLGDHWLGMDNGEQDGRYIGGYANSLFPAGVTREDQYLKFQHHFEKLGNEMGNKMATLVSLNYGHYFLKEGVYTLIGAETAQALPNGQVYYAFLRGAGKQYGVPWFGNASVFNRWGYKVYGATGESEGYAYGPTRGTSLNLLKRLMYSHLLYNCALAGFEMSQLEGDHLSPIGRIQQSAKRWTEQNGNCGTMITPVAIMTDFFAGWTFPRHLYSQDIYRVWGALPYGAGDYLTDNVLDMFYPGYQNSSYYHNETGFLTATPYGDSVDCLLSDAPGWLLGRYGVLVITGELRGGAEIRDKLEAYVRRGGRLIITAGSLKNLPGGLAGVAIKGEPKAFPAGTGVTVVSQAVTEVGPFELYPLTLPTENKVVAKCGEMPAVVEATLGAGSIIVTANPFGVGSGQAERLEIPRDNKDKYDKPLAKPYPMLSHIRVVLDGAFRREMLFDAGADLSAIVCRKGAGQYTLGICNNSLTPKPFKIVSYCGTIEKIREHALDQSEKTAEGYLPLGLEKAAIGVSDENQIAGGDVRIFDVQVQEQSIQEIAHSIPPARPRGLALPLRQATSIQQEILIRPTFFQHFDSVAIDWKYLYHADKQSLEQQAGWLERQKVRVIVDLSSGVNLYPDLRLLNNLQPEYDQSIKVIEEVMGRMGIFGSKDLILTLNRYPENNFTTKQADAAFEETLRIVCQKALSSGIMVYLRVDPRIPPSTVAGAIELIGRVNAPNLKLAASTSVLADAKIGPEQAAKLVGGKVGLWLVAAPEYDLAEMLWNLNGVLSEYKNKDQIASFLRIAPEAPIVLDGIYRDRDQEYNDARVIADLLAPGH